MNDTRDLSLDFAALRDAYARNVLDPVDVVEIVYDRIAADADPHIWLHLIPKEAALARAHRVREARRAGAQLPLYGLPYGVKDNIDIADAPTTAGCAAFAYVPPHSAAVVERLDAAGAICIGKQNLDQFATGLVGIRTIEGACRNAFSDAHVPGGSSSGSAVAVAKGHVAFSIGSDTGGSGRVPAACNNVVGLKPTPGRIGTRGFVYCNRSFDVAPVFALTVGDAFEVFDVLQGADASDPSTLHGHGVLAPDTLASRFPFGILTENQLDFFGDDAARRRYDSAIEALVALGGQPLEIDFAPFFAAGELVFNSALVVERAMTYGETAAHYPHTVHPAVRAALDAARSYRAADVFETLYALDAYRAQAHAVLRDVNVIALPTCATLPSVAAIEADPIAGNARMGRYTYFANPLHLPVISVPAGLRDDGLPFGLSLVASPFAEHRLPALAHALHARTSTHLGATRHRLVA